MASVIWSERSREFLGVALSPLVRDSYLIGEKWLDKILTATERLNHRLVVPHRRGCVCAERELQRAISPDELP